MEATVFIPEADIEEARKQGYRLVRAILAINPDGRVSYDHLQVQTGVDFIAGQPIWEDLQHSEATQALNT